MTDPNASEEDTIQISDPEEYVNQRRLKQIFDTRKQLRERSLRVNAAKNDPEASNWQALCMYRSLVKFYIMETEPLLRQYKPGPTLLDERDFGSARVPPRTQLKETPGRGSNKAPQVYEPGVSDSSDGWVETESQPEEVVVYQLEGLTCLFHAPNPLTAEYNLKTRKHTRSGSEFTHTVEAQIEFNTLDNMVRTVNNFLAEIGFTVEPEPEDNPAMI